MKRIISMILALSMILAIIPNLTAFAETTGTYYSEWGIYFDTSTGTITDCDNSVANLVLPSSLDGVSVTAIGPYAFDGCTGITNLIIPNSVTSISRYAFNNCDGLTQMTIPKSVTTSAEYSGTCGQWFLYCDNLKTVTFEEGTETILKAINDSPALETVNIPNSVKAINAEAFQGCKSLKNIKIPELVTAIEPYTFENCISITEFIIPNNITSISRYAFKNCDGLTQMTIPKSVTTSAEYSGTCGQWFMYCDNLKTVTFEEGTETILKAINDSPALETVILPQSTVTIGEGAFENCKNLKNITIPSNVTAIGGEAFRGCSALKMLKIPSSVTSIGYYAFDGCISLPEIIIPNSVTSISRYAFRNCDGLTQMTIPKSVTTSAEYSGTCGEWFMYCDNLKTIIFEDGTETILKAINDSPALETVILPNSVKAIHAEAFQGCKNLKNIKIPELVTAIEPYTFENCISITEFIIPNNITSISRYAFKNCDGLTQMTIPKSVTTSAEYYGTCGQWFMYCDNLKTITFEEGTETILKAINDSPALETVILPQSTLTIGEGAFESCKNLKNISITPNVTTIENEAFAGCSALKTLEIPSSVTSIGHYAFDGCISLPEIIIPNSVTSIGRGAFKNCDSLKEVIIPNSVIYAPQDRAYSIGGQWFAQCDNLTAVVFEEGTKTILKNCIRDTENLEIVHVPDSVATVEKDAFLNCNKAVIYGAEESAGITAAIDLGMQFAVTEEITYYDYFDFDSTNYYKTSEVIVGYVPFEINYKVKETVELENMVLKIKIPPLAPLKENTLFLNGVILTQYTLEDNILLIPLEDNEGTITFCLEPTEYTSLLTYAQIEFEKDGVKDTEVLNVINCSMPKISVNVPDMINSANVSVEGIAAPSANVDLYLGDTLLGSATALKTGRYMTTVTLPSVEEYGIYTITAKTTTNGTEYTADTTTKYETGAPVLTDFSLQNFSFFENPGKKPGFVHRPYATYSFKASFDNPQNVEKAYVVSSRNNKERYFDMTWDEESQSFVWEGKFYSYVPGKMTVEYTRKKPTIEIGEEIDSKALSDLFIEETKKSSHEIIEETDEKTEAKIVFDDEVKDLICDEINYVINTVDKNYNDIPITSLMKDGKDIYSYLFDKDNKKYILNLDYSDPETYIMIVHDITKNKAITMSISAFSGSKEKITKAFFKKAGKITGYLQDVYQLSQDDMELRRKVMSMNMKPEERQIALDKIDELQSDRAGFLAIALIVGLSTATSGLSVPALMLSLMFGAISTSSDFFWQMRMGDILGCEMDFTCNWAIDPSGYVYEAVPSNRLEGVTATAYWIAPDYIDENGVGDETKAVLWDASEYEQFNPLITDYEGKYAWDVPEGLWQVVFEKDGYETLKTDWLPVPPPQTEVNVGMVSYDAPEIEKAEWDGTNLTVTFNRPIIASTVNNIKLSDAYGENVNYSVSYDSESYNETEISKVFVFDTEKEPALLVANSNVKSYVNIGMENTSFDVTYPSNYVTYDVTTKTVTITSETNHSNANVYIAAYSNGKLISVKSQLKDIAIGDTPVIFSNFDSTGADTVKVMVWESAPNINPLFNTCVVRLK